MFLGYQNLKKKKKNTNPSVWFIKLGCGSLFVSPYPSTHNENHMHSKFSEEILKPDLKTTLKQVSTLYSSLV